MQATRDAAGRMVERGLIEVTQKGAVVQLSEVKGPIRLRLTASNSAPAQQDAGGVQDFSQRKKRRRVDS